MPSARHGDRVQREFSRQAESFASAPALRAPDLVEGVVEALGDAATGRIVDLASGPGIVSGALARRARQVVALDLTERPLRLARAAFAEAGQAHARTVRASVTALPLATGSCDGAVARLALHHLDEPGRALQEASRVLGPGGRLVVLDLLTSDDPREAELHEALERLRDPSHARLFTRDGLRALVVHSGFEIESEEISERDRSFSEWAAIIADPVRTDALGVVMRRLAEEGPDPGLALRIEAGELRFTYRWSLLTARPRSRG